MIKVVTGASLFEAAKNAIKNLGSTNTYIIVPDRATLVFEELLFDTLNLTSTFNLNVVGLSTLAARMVKAEGESLSEIECVLYVKKAVDLVKDKLKYFSAGNINFCKQIYKFISQFQSSSLRPEDIVCKSEKQSLQNKFADLRLVYEQFENLTKDKLDPSEQLSAFAELLASDESLKESEFCFLGFDSFTSKHFQVLEAIAKHCKALTVSLPTPLGRSNAYIYETDIIEKLQKIAKNCSQNLEVVSPPTSLSAPARALAEGLFSQSPKTLSSSKVAIKEAEIPKSEAEFVAKSICYQVFHGKRYRDISVACSDLKIYGAYLASEFEKHKIPYYIDTSVTASQTYTALFFKKMLAFAYKRCKKTDLLFFLNSPFFDFDESVIEIVSQFYEGGGEDFYSRDFGELTELVKLISGDFLAGAQALVAFIKGQSEKIENMGLDAKSVAFELQMPEVLSQLLTAIQTTCNFSTTKEFLSAVEIGLESKEVSALPSYYDQVFVGDATTSYFGEMDTLYLVGANVGALPKYESEASFLSDDEIESAGLKRKVEPTIKMINRRNRFKLFSLLTQFKERLVASYSTSDQEGKPLGKSGLVGMIMKIFAISDVIKNSITPDDHDPEKLLFSVGRSLSEAKLLLLSRRAEFFKPELEELTSLNEKELKIQRNLTVAEQIELGSQIKPTEIEKFYDCPFKVFCENVLKLSLNLNAELTPVEVGSLVHEVIASYGKKFGYQRLPARLLDGFLTQEVRSLTKDRQISDRALVEKRLKVDLKKIIEKIACQSESSPFKLWLVEEKLDGKLGGKKVSGRADRVDKCEGCFTVVDYKTGKITTNLASDVKFGKKLQLLAYAKLLQEKTGLTCGGVYYFDAKTGFKSAQKQSLVGLTSQNAVELGENAKKPISNEQMQQLIDESCRLLCEAADELGKGKVAPYPSEGSCEHCRYAAICLYDAARGTRRAGK